MRPDQIIFATDFSPASAAAGLIAAAVARLFNCPITILHVFQYAPQHRYAVSTAWMTDTIRADTQRQLLQVQEGLADRGVESKTHLIKDGSTHVEILNAAQSYASPIIVIGTHAVAGLDRFLLGSTAECVLREAACPVITVGPHVRWDEHTSSLSRLLFATDFSQESLEAVPFIRVLRDAAASSLVILHVDTDLTGEKASEGGQFDLFREKLSESGLTSHDPETKFLTLHGAAVAQAICNEAEVLSASLVILGVRRASAFTTHLAAKTAFQVIAAAPCAVLTLSS